MRALLHKSRKLNQVIIFIRKVLSELHNWPLTLILHPYVINVFSCRLHLYILNVTFAKTVICRNIVRDVDLLLLPSAWVTWNIIWSYCNRFQDWMFRFLDREFSLNFRFLLLFQRSDLFRNYWPSDGFLYFFNLKLFGRILIFLLYSNCIHDGSVASRRKLVRFKVLETKFVETTNVRC